MTQIEVKTSRDYRVLIGKGLLSQAGELAAPLIPGRRAVVAAGSKVFPLYGETVLESLRRAGFEAGACVFPAGEEAKNTDTLLRIVSELSRQGLTRADVVFALGGGVTGDMVGLAAALYQRGIACVQMPTTLLSAVDSSVGGKTAVNLPTGKNQLGVFSQPRLVICDIDSFQTLPRDVYTEGWAEVIKYAFLREGRLQQLLLSEEPEESLEEIIAACVTIKRDIVAVDEFDTGCRQLLNFGHTIGHAIEACSGYTWYHGMAVAVGMAVMTRACRSLGVCDDDCIRKMSGLLEKFQLPQSCGFSAEELYEAARSDKKRGGDKITLVLPRRFGECELRKTDFEELKELLVRGL